MKRSGRRSRNHFAARKLASLQLGSLVVIDSPGDAARLSVAGNDWLLSLDYLYADRSPNDDPATGLWLRRLEIFRFR